MGCLLLGGLLSVGAEPVFVEHHQGYFYGFLRRQQGILVLCVLQIEINKFGFLDPHAAQLEGVLSVEHFLERTLCALNWWQSCDAVFIFLPVTPK